MKVAVFVHYYVPYRNAGSETMLHAMVKRLQEAGHEVLVVATVMPDSPRQYIHEGVNVLSTNLVYGRQNIETWNPDVIISHHDNTIRAAQIARKLGIPWVFVCHNDMAGIHHQLGLEPDLVVFNSEWLKQRLYMPHMNFMVMHPPVWAEQHKTTKGKHITLVNMSENKGALVFYELARRLPHLNFLGVEGGHGEQILRHNIPNVEIQPHTADMREKVWSRTGVLLMPSIYESYGMAGVEALASGIPVLAHPTPGLLESQGPEGIFLDRDDIDAWERQLRAFDSGDDVLYQQASNRALKRSQELDPRPELDKWVFKLEGLVNQWSA